MTELSYAKAFLSSLDSRPNKLSPDHVEDAKRYPSRTPFTLPKTAHPLPKRAKLAPGAERCVSVTLKSLRNPPLDIALPALPLSTSVLDLKTAITAQAGLPADTLRLLLRKKPVADSKLLQDLAADTDTHLEFAIMVIGGAPSASTPADTTVAQGPSGAEVLATAEFWGDLKGFLTQRLRDEAQAATVFDVFKGAWEAHHDLA